MAMPQLPSFGSSLFLKNKLTCGARSLAAKAPGPYSIDIKVDIY